VGGRGKGRNAGRGDKGREGRGRRENKAKIMFL